MTRGPRIDFPGAFHHVYGRGIEKREIFRDDGDRKELRRRILLNLKRSKASCLAWAFLPNHFHLLFHSEGGVLSRFMHRLMSGYSIYFNRKHVRAGHLFQNRFRSSVIHSEPYLLEAIRYIHLNPVRAGIVPTLEDLSAYPWTSHREIFASTAPLWADFPFLRGFFGGNSLKETKGNYLRFLEMGLRADPPVSFSNDFGTDEDGVQTDYTIAPMENDGAGAHKEVLRVASHVCRGLGIPLEYLRRKRRDRISSNARRAILAKCVTEMGIPLPTVCSWLCITDSGGAYLLRTSFRMLGQDSAYDHLDLPPDGADIAVHEKF